MTKSNISMMKSLSTQLRTRRNKVRAFQSIFIQLEESKENGTAKRDEIDILLKRGPNGNS